MAEPEVIIIKKKPKGHAAHGAAWKVAYADFVTAMMALFLVLWLVSQGDQKLKTAIASYFRAPGAFNTTEGSIMPGAGGDETTVTTILATRDDEKALYGTAALLRKRLSKLTDRGRFKIDVTEEGLHIQVLDKADRASFELGSAELTANTRAILAEIAATIRDLPNSIQIGGHTDAYAFPSPSYTNWELS